jgi:hypothetical protein
VSAAALAWRRLHRGGPVAPGHGAVDAERTQGQPQEVDYDGLPDDGEGSMFSGWDSTRGTTL